MAQLRIALAQVNPTVGDLAGNADLVVRWSKQAAGRGAHLVTFPEMMLTGYPVEDLALRDSFVDASLAALDDTARRLAADGLGDLPVLVGYLDRRTGAAQRAGMPAGTPQNAAALLHGGRVVSRSAKHHLPNYGVFDEFRYFVSGERLPLIRLHGVDVAVAICEDLWQDGGPVAVAGQAGAGLLVSLNASPYERGKDGARLDLAGRRAREAGCALTYVNMVGGQDELVFDGDSLVVDARGELVARSPQFEQNLLVTDLDVPAAAGGHGAASEPAGKAGMSVERVELSREVVASYEPLPSSRAPRLDDLTEVYAALVTGTRDYTDKNGFGSVILALSGGIDSALTTAIATDALGANRVHTVLLPSRHSSEHSISDAEDLVKRQGANARTVPITGIVEAFEGELDLHGLAAENLQARVRGMIVMSLSNEHGHLVLTTGNKSELAVGYSTLYGDTAGGFAPLKDVPKTMVWELARWRNGRARQLGETPPIPENSITKAPSAELRPGQLDTDSLPDYNELDRLLDDYIERDKGRDALIAAGHDADLVDRVLRMVDAAEYKRRQYPPGPKITLKAFGRDRRLPITNRWR